MILVNRCVGLVIAAVSIAIAGLANNASAAMSDLVNGCASIKNRKDQEACFDEVKKVKEERERKGIPTVSAVSAAPPAVPHNKSADRAAIDMCWESYKRKSLDPSSQRFVAGACERMEDEFARSHGHRP